MNQRTGSPAKKRRALAQINKAAERVAKAEARLRELVGGEADAIVDRDGRTLLLRRTQELLLQSEARTRAILESSLDAIVTIDAEGKIVEFNPAATRMFGYSRAEVVNHLPAEVLFPGSMREELARSIVSGEGPILDKRVETIALRADDSEFPVELSLSRVAHDGPIRFTAYIRDISERQQVESIRAQLAAIVESSQDAIFSTTLDGIVTSWNKAAERLYGYSAVEMVGRSVAVLAAPDRLDELRRNFETLAQGEPVEHFETVRRRKDGTQIHVSLTISPIMSALGTILGFSANARDITRRNKLQANLDQLHRLHAQILDSVNEGIHGMDLHGNITFINPAGARMLGWNADELVGKPAHATLHHTTPKGLPYSQEDCPMSETLRKGMTQRRDNELFWRKDDVSFSVEYITAPILNEDGQITGSVVAFHDITGRQRTMAALRESEKRYRTLAEASQDAIFVKDAQGVCLYVNSYGAAQLGRRPEEIIGRSNTELFPPAVAAEHKRNFHKVFESKRPIFFEEKIIFQSKPTWLSTSLVPLLNEVGDVYAVMGVARDITEQKRAEDALIARNQELQNLHEVAQIILDAAELKVAMDRILEKALQVGAFDIGLIRLYDPQTELLNAVSSLGFYDPDQIKPKSVRINNPALGATLRQLITSKEAVLVQDVARAPGLAVLKREGVMCAVVVPVRSGEQILGTIQLGSRTSRQLKPAEVRLLDIFGNQLGVAVQKIRSYEEIKKNLERIHALHDVDVAISSTLNLHNVLDLLLEKISQLFPEPFITTVRLLNRSGRLEHVACRNIDEADWKKSTLRTPGSFSASVLARKAPVAVADLSSDLLGRKRQFHRMHRLVSYLGIPLTAHGKVLGVLGVYSKTRREFSPDEVEFLSTIAGLAAIAIQNAQMYEEMVQANTVKDEFLAVISHELRTPLHVIMGYTQLVRNRVLGLLNERQVNALDKVLDHADAQLHMINTIMQATQIDTMVPERQLVDARELMAQMQSDYERRRDDLGVELVWEYASEPAPLVTDAGMLKQILEHLIDNAIKFTERGTVAISMRSPRGYRQTGEADELKQTAEFKISDTGLGISAENLPRIFEKFYQVDSSGTRRYEGLGLGLYLVDKFTAKLGGKVYVKSQPGKGSTFTVALPHETHL